MKLTDTHCHLNLDAYQDDLPAVISRAESIGVHRVLVPSLDLDSCAEVLKIAENNEIVYSAVGVHPNSALSWHTNTAVKLSKYSSHPKVVAIGEIGLDYYRNKAPKDVQKEILVEQLNIAWEKKLPVILHVRNRSEDDRSCITDLLFLLDEWLNGIRSIQDDDEYLPGVIHSFSGNIPESIQAIKMGFYIGITGAVTFNKAENIRAVIGEVPWEYLLIETDGPFITPHPYRGKRNEPAHVRYIVDKISEITGQPPDKIAAMTSLNAARLFGWE